MVVVVGGLEGHISEIFAKALDVEVGGKLGDNRVE